MSGTNFNILPNYYQIYTNELIIDFGEQYPQLHPATGNTSCAGRLSGILASYPQGRKPPAKCQTPGPADPNGHFYLRKGKKGLTPNLDHYSRVFVLFLYTTTSEQERELMRHEFVDKLSEDTLRENEKYFLSLQEISCIQIQWL